MNKFLLTILFALAFLAKVDAQTNSFPPTGNVGIGVTEAAEQKLTVRMNPSENGSGIAVKAVNNGGPGSQPGFAYLNPLGQKRMYSYLDIASDSYNIGNFTGAALMTINQNGRIGMGNNNPLAPLHVKGSSNGLTGARNALILDNGNLTGNRSNNLVLAANGVSKWEIGNDLGANGTQDFYIIDAQNSTNPRLFINPQGNVSIGTADAKNYKLAVAGNIVAESITVKMQGSWPDYVFKNTYKQPTLSDLEKYIKENGHLPKMPSAQEVEIKGINLGNMNAKLLEKIEELTLHLIAKEKQIVDQQSQLNSQNSRIDNLELLIRKLIKE